MVAQLDPAALTAGFAKLPAPPVDIGAVRLVVVRRQGEQRVLPDAVRLTTALGVVGDRWSLHASPNVQSQVTIMRADVAELMAVDGDIARFGDNLFVTLDLSEENLPAGSRLGIGSAIVEVTSKPHTGCNKFKARAGQAALDMTRLPEFGHLRLRGIHARVLVDGDVAKGDRIVVTRI